MSGWIKMGTGLRDHPKVVRMAGMLKSDCLRVVGALHAVWSIFDEHSPDGLLEFYTLRAMDEKIGWRGFSQAMQAIGWLIESESGLQAPDYEEHNGPSAKRRATETKRKAESRQEQGDTRTKSDRMADRSRLGSGQMSASDADTLRARIDKRRREEEKDPPASRVPPVAVAPATNRGSRLPLDWALPEQWENFPIQDLGWHRERVEAEACKFADYWHAKTGKDATKADWFATWRNWCRNARPEVGIMRSGHPQTKSFAERDAETLAARIHEMTGGNMGKPKAAELPDFIDMEEPHGRLLG